MYLIEFNEYPITENKPISKNTEIIKAYFFSVYIASQENWLDKYYSKFESKRLK